MKLNNNTLKFLSIKLLVIIGLLCLPINSLQRKTKNLCSTGTAQSPIKLNLSKYAPMPEPNLKILYNNIAAKMNWNKQIGAFSIEIPVREQKNYPVELLPVDLKTDKLQPKKVFLLEKILFKLKSEHIFDDENSSMEIQFIHRINKASPKYFHNRLAFSIMVEPTDDESKIDNFLLNILPYASFDMNGIMRATNGQSYYHYIGSLTNPPCSQDVNWIVFDKSYYMSSGIYNSIKSVLKQKTGKEFNNRPVQNLGGRKVYKSGGD